MRAPGFVYCLPQVKRFWTPEHTSSSISVQAGLYLTATLGAAERALSLQRLSAAAAAAALALLLWRLLRSGRLGRVW